MPETITNGVILKQLDVKNLTKEIENLIKKKDLRKELQSLSIKNFYLTHNYVSKLIDKIRNQKLLLGKKINAILPKKIFTNFAYNKF